MGQNSNYDEPVWAGSRGVAVFIEVQLPRASPIQYT